MTRHIDVFTGLRNSDFGGILEIHLSLFIENNKISHVYDHTHNHRIY